MADRADAHIHLFEGGFRGSFTGRPGVQVDESACYDSLARDHAVRAALIVGYAARPWCADNNAWIARQARTYAWARPLAYVEPADPPTVARLDRWRREGFVGLSMYITDSGRADALRGVPDDLWGWLEERRWMVSVNSRGELWRAWGPILERHGALRLLASHLGQPPRVAHPPELPAARAALEPVLALAEHPGPRVKLSGFYSITDPGHDYPHRTAWPYVRALLERFGAERLLWASDYTPCLDSVTFPQACAVVEHMPFLAERDRHAIVGGSLLRLLDEQQG